MQLTDELAALELAENVTEGRRKVVVSAPRTGSGSGISRKSAVVITNTSVNLSKGIKSTYKDNDRVESVYASISGSRARARVLPPTTTTEDEDEVVGDAMDIEAGAAKVFGRFVDKVLKSSSSSSGFVDVQHNNRSSTSASEAVVGRERLISDEYDQVNILDSSSGSELITPSFTHLKSDNMPISQVDLEIDQVSRRIKNRLSES
jgi:hypothetical protein